MDWKFAPKTLPLARRLGLLLGVAALSIGLLAALAWRSLEQTREISALAIKAAQMGQEVQRLFLARLQLQSHKSLEERGISLVESEDFAAFEAQADQVLWELPQLGAALQEHDAAAAMMHLAELENKLVAYRALTREWAQAVDLRDGFWAELVPTGERLESMARLEGDASLRLGVVELRRLESRYESRPEAATANAMNIKAREIAARLSGSSVPPMAAEAFRSLLLSYGSKVDKLVLADAELGLSPLEGLRGQDAELSAELLREAQNLSRAVGAHFGASGSWRLGLAVLLLIALVMAWVSVFRRRLLLGIERVEQATLGLLEGQAVPREGQSPIRELALLEERVDSFALSLAQKTQFAQRVEQGHFDADLPPLGPGDSLTEALNQMAESLRAQQEEQAKAHEHEAVARWMEKGASRFAEILQRHSGELDAVASAVLSGLVEQLGAAQGAFFLLDDEHDPPGLRQLAAFAYGRERAERVRFALEEGLVGRCVAERETLLLKEVPPDFARITSGLGQALPNCYLVAPMATPQAVLGAIELSSFSVFAPEQVAFLERICAQVATALERAKIASKTELLLERSKEQAEELAAQEEEMRQNLEELQATQEESARKEARMASIIETMDDALFVIEYDTNGRVRRASDVALEKLGLSMAEAMKLIHSDLIDEQQEIWSDYAGFWKSLRQGQGHRQQSRMRGRQGMLWLDESFSPILDADGETSAVLHLAHDITAFVQLEAETQVHIRAIEEHERQLASRLDLQWNALLEQAGDRVLVFGIDQRLGARPAGREARELAGSRDFWALLEDPEATRQALREGQAAMARLKTAEGQVAEGMVLPAPQPGQWWAVFVGRKL